MPSEVHIRAGSTMKPKVKKNNTQAIKSSIKKIDKDTDKGEELVVSFK